MSNPVAFVKRNSAGQIYLVAPDGSFDMSKYVGVSLCLCNDQDEAVEGRANLVRQLDVLLNGEEGAAKQASLCDIVAQVAKENPRATVAELLETLKLAEEMVVDWGAYASDYFKEKWNLDGDLAKMRAVIAKHEKKDNNG